MEERTGILSIQQGVSRLDGATLLARPGQNPLQAGTNFLVNQGLRRGSIDVTGDMGPIGTGAAFFMVTAQRAVAPALLAGAAPMMAEPAVKTARRPAAKKASSAKKVQTRKPSAKKVAKPIVKKKASNASRSAKPVARRKKSK
jgi:hypothetical protein